MVDSSDVTWVFVVGLPLTARDLVENLMLCLHPDVHITGHTDFPLAIYDLLGGTGSGDDSSVTVELRRFDASSQVVGKVGFPSRVHALPGMSGRSREDLTRDACESLRSWLYPWVRVFGDSSQTYCLRHADLRRIFPDCRMIVVHRDPDVYIREMVRTRGLEGNPDEIERQRAFADGVRREIRSIRDALHVEIRDLKSDPRRWYRTILEHVGLDIDRHPHIEYSIGQARSTISKDVF